MKIDEALRNVTRLFLDTAPIIYFVERNPRYLHLVDEIFQRIDRSTPSAVTFPITLSECLVVPFRLGNTTLQKDFEDLIVIGQGVTFIQIEESNARRAAQLRAVYNISLADAFQIASALTGACNGFLTNDRSLKRVQELPVLVLDDLEV